MPSIQPPQSWTNYGSRRSRVWTYLGGQTSDSTVPLRITYGTRSRTSLETPQFSLKKKTGSLPENHFTYIEKSFSARVGYVEVHRKHPFNSSYYRSSLQQGTLGDWVIDATPGFALLVFNAQNEAIAKLREKIKEPDVNLLVLAGEAKETVRMLKDINNRLALLLSALKNKDPGKFLGAFDFGAGGKGKPPPLHKGATAQAANIHLMYWYGIRPLVSDALGIARALQKGLRKKQYTVKSVRVKSADSLVVGSLGHPGATCRWAAEVEVSARAKYSVNDPVLATLADLGLTNIPQAIWELTRLSFVADWVIGMGSWLSQVDAALGKEIYGSSVTTYIKVLGNIDMSRVNVQVDALNRRTEVWSAGREDVSVERRALAPGELPFAPLPAIVPKTDLFQVITSAALLRQGAFKF